MNMDKYIRSTRTLQREPWEQIGYYGSTYSSLLQLLPNCNANPLWSLPHLPVLLVVYSLQRTHELVSVERLRFLIYDQYLGQTFNMLNRIWSNSVDGADSTMYAFKLLSEYYAVAGEYVLAITCAGCHAKLKLECDAYRRDRDLARRRSLTWTQEAYMMAHELAHAVMFDPRKSFSMNTNDDWEKLPFSLFLKHVARGLELPEFEFKGLDLTSATGSFPLFPNTGVRPTVRTLYECKCDALAILLTIALQRKVGFSDASQTLIGAVLAIRHLRMMGCLREVAFGSQNFDSVTKEYRLRTMVLRELCYDIARVTGVLQEYAEGIADASDRYEELIDEPVLGFIGSWLDKTRREIDSAIKEDDRKNRPDGWLQVVGDLTESGPWNVD